MRMNRLFPSLVTALLSFRCYAACHDSVGDGICDFWRAKYFGGPGTFTNSLSCASCDPDQDGLSNLEEYHIGSDPTDPTSPFRFLSIALSGDDVLVTWATAGNHTNMLEVSLGAVGGTLDTNTFYVVATNSTSGTAIFTNSYLDSGAATNTPIHYYRVHLIL
jgi:hypothetical protein